MSQIPDATVKNDATTSTADSTTSTTTTTTTSTSIAPNNFVETLVKDFYVEHMRIIQLDKQIRSDLSMFLLDDTTSDSIKIELMTNKILATRIVSPSGDDSKYASLKLDADWKPSDTESQIIKYIMVPQVTSYTNDINKLNSFLEQIGNVIKTDTLTDKEKVNSIKKLLL